MRRIKLVLTVGVMMAAMLAFSAAPAMADDLDFGGFDDDIEVEDFDVEVEEVFFTGDEFVLLLAVDDFDVDFDEDEDFDFEDEDFDFCDCDDDDDDDDDDGDDEENAFIFQGDDRRFGDNDFIDFD
jgi:hypothetical protein